MKKINAFVFLFLSWFCSAVYGQTVIDADNPNIQYIGRVKFTNPKAPAFDWPDVHINAVFEGTSLGVQIQDQYNNSNYYNVFIDSRPVYVFTTLTTQTTYYLASGLSNSSHTVLITKRGETGHGRCIFKGFILDNGKTLLAPPARPNRRIECIGDSFTTGYGNEGVPGSVYTTDLINSYLAYGPMVTRHFNADCHITGKSGIGMVRNYQVDSPTSPKPMPYYYADTVKQDELNDWDFNSWQADVVTILLGGADYSVRYSSQPVPTQQQFEDGYYNFVKLIRLKNPNAHIFCMFNASWWATAASYVPNVVTRLNLEGDSNVHPANLNLTFVHTPVDDWGCEG